MMFSWLLLFSSIGVFFANSMKKGRRFATFTGFLYAEMMALLVILFFLYRWNPAEVDTGKYIFVFILISIYNFYIATNSAMILLYRTKKFYITDSHWSFYCFHIDWFSYYVKDYIYNTETMRRFRKTRKVKRDAALRRIARKKKDEEREKQRELKKKRKNEKKKKRKESRAKQGEDNKEVE